MNEFPLTPIIGAVGWDGGREMMGLENSVKFSRIHWFSTIDDVENPRISDVDIGCGGSSPKKPGDYGDIS